ncbi:MAG: SIS domain-containing protein [candidate division FCPU426 bacterium]
MSDALYIDQYLSETRRIAETLDRAALLKALTLLRNLKASQGRLFILGVGGSAGNASHAVNDFRKIAGIESYAPTDNVSELTAWTNDSGWDQVFERWLMVSKLGSQDALLVLSVGGGSPAASQNLVKAMDLAKSRGAKILAIVSRDGGHAAKVADACILVPVLDAARITPHAEGWQAIIWHLLVNALVQP